MKDILLALALVVTALVPYWQVRGHDFVAYDDNLYVTQNARVQGGLTLGNASWGLTTLSEANWHPLTWWSHMLDWSLFGPDAGGHHLTSAVLHAVNAGLLFLVLCRMTGARWRSALVAALFALHPLNVESVAWIAQRKTVLATLFGLLALWGWAGWSTRRALRDYLLALGWFALSLMAKPLLVTLPFLLLLLDWWPLRRLGRERPARLVLETLPFLALAAASSAITYLAQHLDHAVKEAGPLGARLATAVVGYAAYLEAAVWPLQLAPLYPRPPSWPAATIAASAAVLIAVSAVAAAAWRRGPHLMAGWLWYLGTLVPMVGLVQVGLQSHADRYAYFSLIGIFLMVAWSLPARARLSVVPAAAAVLLALGTLTWAQVRLWRDSRTLFTHTVAITGDNPVMQHNLAEALRQAGEVDSAIVHDEEAVRLDPALWGAWNSLGVAYAAQGRLDDARRAYERAIATAPGVAALHGNLAGVLARQGHGDEALARAREAVRLQPDAPEHHYLVGVLLAGRGRRDEAAAAQRAALARSPDHLPALVALAESLLENPERSAADVAEVIPLLERACALTNRQSPRLLDLLAVAYAMEGRLEEARETGEAALAQARTAGDAALASEIEAHLARFRELRDAE